MKVTTVWKYLYCLLIGSIMTIAQAEELTVVLQVNESKPVWSEENPSRSLGSEIIAAISKEAGIKTRIEFIPLKRLIANTSNNDIGNPLFYMNNQDFSAIIPISVSYSTAFTYHKGIHKASEFSYNTKKRIGVLKGTSSAKLGLEKFGKIEESNSKESLFKKLKAGRLDIVIDLYLSGNEAIQRLFPNEIDHFDGHIIHSAIAPIAIMLDSNYPDGKVIGKRYQEALHRIIKNGVYRKIMEKYFTKGELPSTHYKNLLKFEELYSSDTQGDIL